MVAEPDTCAYQGIVVAVAHRQYKEKTATGEIAKDLGARNGCIVYDLKSVLPRDGSDLRLLRGDAGGVVSSERYP